MRRLSIALIAAASTIAFTQIASAADLPRKAPAYVAPLPPPPDWSGVYVGLEGGYGWGHQNLNAVIPGGCFICEVITDDVFLVDGGSIFFPDVAVPSAKQKGWLFGGFAGAQKQWGSWVLGIEGDFDAADIKGSGITSDTAVFNVHTSAGKEELTHITVTQTVANASKIDELGSLRGKVGFVLAPNWLIYGTGGLAFAHVKNAFTDTESFTEEYEGKVHSGTVFSASAAGGTSMFGYAVGAGVDWKWPVDAGSAWVFGVEYLHYGFGDHTITLTDNTGFNTVSFNTNERVDTIKGRISYLFGIH